MRKATLEREHPTGLGGTQRLYQFDNGFGASVVRFLGSYGFEEDLWELAVVQYSDDDIHKFSITYDTEITDDVIGHLTEDEVDEILNRIERLPKTENT